MPADAASVTESGAWTPPPADEQVEETYTTVIDGLIYKFRRNSDIADRLVDFAVVLLVRHNEREVMVAEADIRHGMLHVHYYDQSGERVGNRKDLRPVSTQEDVEDCYAAALDWFEENWEDCKRRWARG
jgi:hypothetical protein